MKYRELEYFADFLFRYYNYLMYCMCPNEIRNLVSLKRFKVIENGRILQYWLSIQSNKRFMFGISLVQFYLEMNVIYLLFCLIDSNQNLPERDYCSKFALILADFVCIILEL